MESDAVRPSTDDAAEQLRNHDDVRDRVAHRGPSRAFALLMLWSAIMLSVYVGLFLLAFGSRPLDEMSSSAGRYSTMLVFPILVFSALVSGARERFSIRTKPSLGHWIAYGLIVAAFLGMLGAIVAGVGYPWWLNILVPAALFVTMAARPIAQLQRAATPDSDPWVSKPLSGPARATTVMIGAALGLIAATSSQPWFPLVNAAVMLLLVVVLAGWRARWGLPRTGYEWGPVHWTGFGISTGVLFLLAVLLARTESVTAPISMTAGILILLVMLLASMVPFRARSE